MKELQYPPSAHWEVTPECNHNCIHCYNYWRKAPEKIASMKTVFPEEHYLQIARKLVDQKVNAVSVTGGEPLLVFRKIVSSIELLKANGVSVSMNTNAVLMTDYIIDFVKKHHIRLFISFPCGDEKTCDFITNREGSYQRILHSLDILVAKKVDFSLNIVVSKASLGYLEETVKFLKERYNVPKIFITRVGKPVNSDESFNQYLLSREDLNHVQDICVKANKEYGIEVDTACPYPLCSINSQESFDLFGMRKSCTAGKVSYAVDTFGNVKACPRDSTIYGNILKEDFSVIWKRMESWRDGSLLPAECKRCRWKKNCKGGCRVDAYPFTGKLDALDTFANPSNLPLKFHKKETATSYLAEDVFEVHPFRVVEEAFGYRISCSQLCSFVTRELKDYLLAHSTFTFADLMNDFSVDSATATHILSRLAKNHIVHLIRR